MQEKAFIYRELKKSFLVRGAKEKEYYHLIDFFQEKTFETGPDCGGQREVCRNRALLSAREERHFP